MRSHLAICTSIFVHYTATQSCQVSRILYRLNLKFTPVMRDELELKSVSSFAGVTHTDSSNDPTIKKKLP